MEATDTRLAPPMHITCPQCGDGPHYPPEAWWPRGQRLGRHVIAQHRCGRDHTWTAYWSLGALDAYLAATTSPPVVPERGAA